MPLDSSEIGFAPGWYPSPACQPWALRPWRPCVGRDAVQAAIGNGLSVDPFPFEEAGLAVSEANISRGEIADALASVVVVGDPETGEITNSRPRAAHTAARATQQATPQPGAPQSAEASRVSPRVPRDASNNNRAAHDE